MAANIFEQYGIKEVANVYFEALAADTSAGVAAGDIVLFLNTLKVSTIEQTAEQTDARGGWGYYWAAPTLKNPLNCWNTLRANLATA